MYVYAVKECGEGSPGGISGGRGGGEGVAVGIRSDDGLTRWIYRGRRSGKM